MKRKIALVLVLLLALPFAGCSGDGDILVKILIRDYGPMHDDYFEVYLDDTRLGTVNPTAAGTIFEASLSPGDHELRIVFVTTSQDGDNGGTLSVKLLQGAVFSTGGTAVQTDLNLGEDTGALTIVVAEGL